ncbi:type III secretion system export apparatus subunit SctR [Leisingera sp. SS27]|uniref:type III secretion system export apparatus subunit SctR n=1 Tax=unclassified Leisingera TaxID=2614906 RepID=UPI0021A803DF|nr:MULTISPECIES: type III secretion system export apparatus subunit SctR [unclassified Leisingera]MDC0659474.1 type III secretion system export apparatus subunit SctR [Leisingera sp. SS27]UWQ81657.1 type III secretion system export apparatus subunit SctR [Leisingera sp. S132]
MSEDLPAIIPTAIAIMGLTFLPFLVVMGTAFTKISIVLMLLRNALGVQQAPSGMVINSIALTLTAFIMVPVGDAILRELQQQNLGLTDWDSALRVFDVMTTNMSGYLTRFSNERELEFFMDAARAIWPETMHGYIKPDNIFLLLPAHVTSEITRAFEIAFLLFLPFVVVDMIVSNILLAMGAMMVPPMLVSLPIKILLFVAADGWARLLHGLILSYV